MTRFNRRGALAIGATGITSLMAASAAGARQVRSILPAYLDAWTHRDLEAILACVTDDLHFRGPNVETHGREAYREATKRFLGLLEGVTARAHYGDAQGAMIAYDFRCIAPVGPVPTAELIGYRDGRIVRSEIFFDTRPFQVLSRPPEEGRSR